MRLSLHQRGVLANRATKLQQIAAARQSAERTAVDAALALDHAERLADLLEVMADKKNYPPSAMQLSRIAAASLPNQGNRIVEIMIGAGLQPHAQIFRMAIDCRAIMPEDRTGKAYHPQISTEDLANLARGRKHRADARATLHCLGFAETTGHTWIPFEDGGRWPKQRRDRAALAPHFLVRLHMRARGGRRVSHRLSLPSA